MTDVPTREGWYERIYLRAGDEIIERDWWDGSRWYYDPSDKPCYIQYRAWRGLKEPHNEHIHTR